MRGSTRIGEILAKVENNVVQESLCREGSVVSMNGDALDGVAALLHEGEGGYNLTDFLTTRNFTDFRMNGFWISFTQDNKIAAYTAQIKKFCRSFYHFCAQAHIYLI